METDALVENQLLQETEKRLEFLEARAVELEQRKENVIWPVVLIITSGVLMAITLFILTLQARL